MRNTVTLNGISSSTIQGLLIQELPPISKPMIRTNIEEIDGRDGDIVTKLGYSAYDKEVSIGLYGNFDINQVIAFFNTEGEVIFSNEPDKYYRYKILEQIDFERLIRFRTATVTFHVQPFKYEVNEDPIEENSNIEEDSVPYAFRKSPYGDRKIDEIVGGSIAWNQLHPISTRASATSSDVLFTNNNDGSITANGTASATALWTSVSFASLLVNGHKYLLIGCPSGGGGDKYQLSLRSNNGSTVLANDIGSGKMYSATSGLTNIVFYLRVVSGVTVNNIVFRPQLFDLTQMFGSAIADYIYSLEQSSSGSGVAWFRSLFNKPYYAFNSGELISVNGLSAHKMTGFNQWDEEWEVGGIGGTGANQSANDRIRSKNYIPVVPNSTYYYRLNSQYGLYTWGYDADKNYVGRVPSNAYAVGNNTITIPSDVCYIRIVAQPGYGTTYKNDICINLAWDGERNGEYEPYEVHSYALDDSLTLRGVPKLDAGNEMYFDGDIYQSDGTVQRRYQHLTFDGTENWGIENAGWQTAGLYVYYLGLTTATRGQGKFPASDVIPNILANNYVTGTYSDLKGRTKPVVSFTANGTYIEFSSSTITTLADWKTWLSNNNVTIVYELATPTTEYAEPYQNLQICNEYGTEEYVSAEQNGVTMIVGHNTEYSSQISATIINKGNYISKPKITVYGTGTVGVYLNGVQAFSIDMDGSDYITIDAEKMEAYQGDILKNRKVTGDYSNFIFNVGENILSVSGYVTNLELRNYSRWL